MWCVSVPAILLLAPSVSEILWQASKDACTRMLPTAQPVRGRKQKQPNPLSAGAQLKEWVRIQAPPDKSPGKQECSSLFAATERRWHSEWDEKMQNIPHKTPVPLLVKKHSIILTPLRTYICIYGLRGLEKCTPTVNSGGLWGAGKQEGDFCFLLYRLFSCEWVLQQACYFSNLISF